jgi:hypothetical protein
VAALILGAEVSRTGTTVRCVTGVLDARMRPKYGLAQAYDIVRAAAPDPKPSLSAQRTAAARERTRAASVVVRPTRSGPRCSSCDRQLKPSMTR